MSYGGYANRGHDYHQRRDRINEDEVPESKHTIFIRGLPGDMSTDEIREYFEDRIGPVSFDFVKTSADQQRLFVAVRFETRDDAKEAMSKYSDSDLMGHRCELSWFKDIRRYAQYQSMNQSRRGRPMFRSRGYQNGGNRGTGRDSHQFDRLSGPENIRYKRRHSERDDDKSRSRSRDRGRSSSYSRSPSAKSGDSSRSRSRSSDRGATDDRRKRSASRETNSDREKDREYDDDPEKKRPKKEKKHRKSKKKRSRTASRSSSDGHSSTPDRAIFGRHAPAGSPISPNQEEQVNTPPAATSSSAPAENTEAEPVFTPSTLTPAATNSTIRFPIRIQTPASVISNTSFTIGIESDELPRRVFRNTESGAMVTPPSIAAQEEEKQEAQKESKPNVIAAIGLPPPPCPPLFVTEEKAIESAGKGVIESDKSDARSTEPSKTTLRSSANSTAALKQPQSDTPMKTSARYPTSARYFGQLKEIQGGIIKTVKAEPKPDEGFGGLRLSSLATCQQDTEEEKRVIREGRLSKLDEIALERFLVRKKKLEETFRGDCQTYAFVARKLIEKDPSLESQIRIALIENMEDLEKQVYEQVDAYLDTVFE